jgi:hypothetical protein
MSDGRSDSTYLQEDDLFRVAHKTWNMRMLAEDGHEQKVGKYMFGELQIYF